MGQSEKLICRPAKNECDLPEFCNGTDPFCPHDLFKENGASCKGLDMSCASGKCTSRDEQCKVLAKKFDSTGDCSSFGLIKPSEECRMHCETSLFGCVAMSDFYIDGTLCSFGRCIKGKCIGFSWHSALSILNRLLKLPHVIVFIPILLFTIIILFIATFIIFDKF